MEQLPDFGGKKRPRNILAGTSNQKFERSEKDSDRDYWMRSAEAKVTS